MIKHKSNWIKRIIAAGMTVSMVMTSVPALAENTAEEYESQDITEETLINDDSSEESGETESQTENAEFSDTASQIEESENHSEDVETGESENQSENTEDTEKEIASEDTTEDEDQEIQLSLELVSSGEDADVQDIQSASLTLNNALQLSDKLKMENDSIRVTDGEGLILLSNVQPQDYQNKKIELITTAGWDVTQPVTVNKTSYSFLGLGNENYPYKGTFELDKATSATQYSISTSKSLFNVLSADATLGMIPFSISEKATATDKPLLAEKLQKGTNQDGLSCDIALRDLNSSQISDAAIGGLIGSMDANAKADISFENQFNADLKVNGESHTGLFCNTMGSGASLNVTFTNSAGKIYVQATANNADAGGFVGQMQEGTLTIAGNSVNKVTSSSGNAGGIVGSSNDGMIQLKVTENESVTFTFSDMTLTAGSSRAAGGLIGKYIVTRDSNIEYDLSAYQFGKTTISGGENVGGLFGAVENTASTGNISISGKSADDNSLNVTVSKEVTNFGGIIGSYQAANMGSSLSLLGDSGQFINVESTGGSNAKTSYGGMVGTISGNSYVEIENVSAFTADMKNSEDASFGGLVGKIENGLINVGNVTLNTKDSYDLAIDDNTNAADKVDGRGGLVGHLVKGVLRLHGETDLSAQKITIAYNHVGQIVGNNDNGLVYALGDGNGLNGESGWSLIRYADSERSGSDIGNWGSVVRLGDKLTEGFDGAFTFDENVHTVTVNNGTGENISSTNAFVAYALAFDISKVYEEENSALRFIATINPKSEQNVSLTNNNIDLTDTGVLGIGKDIDEQNFTGTFDGNDQTITLDIGTTYGMGVSERKNAAGQVYTKRSDERDAHYSLALIPFAKDAIIQNVTIGGAVNCKVPTNDVNQEESEDDIRYPAFASGVIGLASGKTTFKNVNVNAKVSVTEEDTSAKKLHVWQSGFLGRCEGTALTFENCTWEDSSALSDERSTDNQRIGGLAAEVMGGCSVSVKNSVLSGSIKSSAPDNGCVGGLIAVSRGEVQNDTNNTFKLVSSTIDISNLQVNGEKIKVGASETSGGLLGYKWRDTDVTFTSEASGVTVSDSALNAEKAQFGGLVYLATGYWNATAKDSIVFATSEGGKVNSLIGKSTEDAPSGLLIGTGLITEFVRQEDKNVEIVPSALYLEMGTYGSDENAAYKIGQDSVSLDIDNSEHFDELVGITKYDDARDRNAVVSIAVHDKSGNAILFDNTENNTYTYQTGKHYKNPHTRYYYNLDAYRKNIGVEFETVTSEESLVLWSVSQYAANTIKNYFWSKANPTGPNIEDKQTDVTISGNIDLTGYSYYPVTPLGTVTLGNDSETSLTFNNETIETVEENNKKPSDSEQQHYLMHHGLLYNVNYSVNVNNVVFSGTVGKELVSDNMYNSGALIFGTASGDTTKTPIEIKLNNVTLNGIRVTDIKKASVKYAPLMINKIDRAVKLTVDTLSTGVGYTTGDGQNKTTVYAATSLIGNVGSKDATKLTLSFSNIALDGRVEKETTLSETVLNNGEKEVNYYTTHTIFTRATLLEKFQYVPAEGSGAYNFNSTDTMVTYGVELTNTSNTTGLTGRNPDKQYEYYDGGYICDESTTDKSEDYVKSRYDASNFIRYVCKQEDSNESLFELDINQRATGLLEGCGTYGDPYIIKDGEQLISLAAYIKASTTVNDFQVVFNSKVFAEKKQTSAGYHNKDGATSEASGSDATYKWENGKWLDSENAEQNDKFTETATQYLLNAYYEIATEIKIASAEYAGLGTFDNPFSGVIVGQNQNTVTISCTGNRLGFGGLIAYSRGSVVKDLTLDYSGTSITMSSSEYPGSNNNYPFFGGVVGYCMGGDTIIDQVSVKYSQATIDFSGTKDNNDVTCLIPAGGYVGLVGGAASTKYTDGYEKDGGGVVFRNMDSTSNTFDQVCKEAYKVNKTVSTDGTATDGGKYFYRNPYVGRVLDGYVCSEEVDLKNTDKNYTIPTLQKGENDLVVRKDTNSLNVTVNSAQGLWILSAIVNSGAGAMSSDGTYADVDNKTVDAYQIGKPRTVSYEAIGKEAGENADKYLADEKYWGGVASTSGSDDAKNRVSYLVKNYTSDTNAAYLAGKSSTADSNTPVVLTFSDNINMTNYGNGFRGIGSSYGNNMGGWQIDYSIPKVYRRNLLIKSINEEQTTDTTITLEINQNDYYDEYKNGSWRNQGAGLFVDFHFENGCTVNHLKISGNVKAGIFKSDGTLTYLDKYVDKEYVSSTGKKYEREEDVGVGGFAARTANSWGKVTFSNFHLDNLNVYGGTSTGGAIGYVDYPGNNSVNNSMIIFGSSGENEEYQPWSINNVNVLESINNNGSAGGLIGWYESGRMLNINGYGSDSDKQNITTLNVKTIAQSINVATAGGLVGALDFGSITVNDVTATNVDISGENLRDVGGLVAGARQAGSISISNCVLDFISVESTKNEHASQGGIGGVLGYHETKIATISGVEIKGNSSITGLKCVGGFVGRSNQTITIENCKASGTNISAQWNDAGGFVGILKNKATIKNVKQNNINILAARNAGGLIGNIDGGNGAGISNVECSEVITVTQNNVNCAGGLIGWANNKTVNGYNILFKNCRTGYSASSSNVADLNTVELKTTDICGFWIGESSTGGQINLVAVSASGSNSYPQCDVGTKTAGTVKIIYADKSADETYQPIDKTSKPYASANPWVDVNPKSDVPFADGTVMTGNGVGITADGTAVAQTIIQGISTEDADSDRYWNLKESKDKTDETYKTFSQFLDSTNDAYITTYKAEKSANTTVSSDIDFPILVVNNSAEIDTMLWNYIAAMTNVSSGTNAKNQIKDITATTYKWDSNENNFTAQTNSSLNVNAAKKISIVPNAYDNQNSQFTLLDVTYANPVDNKAEPFHLYIPVLVKKVLYISFDAKFLAGTDYCVSDYPEKMQREHYATAGFDEPVTAYMEYNYDEDTDWQSMLDNGENLLWHYDKILDLAQGSSATTGKNLLPRGTRLTLVDRQTKQYYTYTTDGTEEVHSFNLASMKTPDGKMKFDSVDICDLLNLNIKLVPDDEIKDGITYYVKESDPANATVQKDGTYYRKALDSDTNAEKYRITVDSTVKAKSESYYLTIQIPVTEGYSAVNNRLNYGSFSRKEGTLPAKIKSDADLSGSSYVIYDGVEQTLTASTRRIHNGSNMNDTIMENGDSIEIELKSILKLTEGGKQCFSKLGPSEYYHQFDINLKKYLKENSEYSAIGTEDVVYEYTLSGNGLNKTVKGSIQNAAGEESLTIKYGNSALKAALEKAVDDNTVVTITAKITLAYEMTDYFPKRDTSDNNDQSGISVVATSRLANTESQLSITTNKRSREHENRYYTANPSRANLTYSTVDEAHVGDTTQQLGINPSDEDNLSDMIYTKADYDYSNVDADVLKRASQIRYTMELFQKNANGTYDETAPLTINEYLQDMNKDNKSPSTVKNGYQWTEKFTEDNTRHQFSRIYFAPLTGTEFENKGYMYANYKVRLSVVLLDETGKEIDGTKSSDYIIYTNARIYQEILDTLQSTEKN